MERNQYNDLSKPLYQKLLGTGGLRLRNPLRRIKPGEYIRISPEELGKYLKEFKLVEGPKETEKDKEVVAEKKEDRFTAVPRGSGWFDVVDTLVDKKINEKGYRQNEAEKYASELNEGHQTPKPIK